MSLKLTLHQPRCTSRGACQRSGCALYKSTPAELSGESSLRAASNSPAVSSRLVLARSVLLLPIGMEYTGSFVFFARDGHGQRGEKIQIISSTTFYTLANVALCFHARADITTRADTVEALETAKNRTHSIGKDASHGTR